MPKFYRYHQRRPDLNAFDLLSLAEPCFYWAEPGSANAWSGRGIIASLKAGGTGRFQEIKRDAEELLSQVEDLNSAPVSKRLFGGFSFTPDSLSPAWNGFSEAEFILPRLQINRSGNETWLTICRPTGPGLTLETLEKEASSVRRVWGLPAAALQNLNDEISFEDWQEMIESAVRDIRAGKLSKVVLSRARSAEFDGDLNPLPALKKLDQNYPNTYRFLFSPRAHETFLGATPELIARVSNREMFSVAMAGSIGRGNSDTEDNLLAEELLHSAKDRSEQEIVVRAIRAGLEPVTSNLKIPASPGIRRLANIQHLETPVSGKLNPGRSVVDVVEVLHPTPALGGIPRKLALDFIAKHESTRRGWYGGPVGWLDEHGDGTFAVAIRSALLTGNQALLYAGAGIVEGSNPREEWKEIELKFKPLMDALAASGIQLKRQVPILAGCDEK